MIFDLDGTLADTMPLCLEAYRRTFRLHLGREFSDPEITAFYGPNDEGIVQRAVPEDWQSALATFLREYAAVHQNCTSAFPGIETALDLLQAKGIRLGIATGKGVHSAKYSIDFLGLAHYFDAMETGSEKGGVKPQLITRIVDSWGFDPGEVAYLGDWPSDVDGSKEAGVVALSAGWAKGSDIEAMRARGPQAVFAQVKEFIAWIETNVEPVTNQTRS